MNIVFFGSDNFGVPSLKALLSNNHNISCVVTQPDRKKGRGLFLSSTVIKKVALELGIKIYQPYRVNTPETIKFLKDLSPDLFVVIAYGQILSQEILDIPKVLSINIHASLLPKYRGAAPVNWAIIRGEEITGVTVMKMAREMDAGPIILQKALDIADEDTAVTLEDSLSHLGVELLLDALKSIESRNYNLMPQDEGKASFAPKLKKENGRINWNLSARDIYNLIRGCLNWPGAFTYYQRKLLKIYKAKVSSGVLEFSSYRPGEIISVSKEGISVVTGKDNLTIEELQIEGKRRMSVEEFIAGHKICIGETLGKK